MTGSPLALALVGVGYWGPNLLRAAADLEDAEVTVVCDISAQALAAQGRRHPYVRLTQRLEDVLGDDSIDAVLVATPVQTHHEIDQRCMRAGKHVFVRDTSRTLVGVGETHGALLSPRKVFV